MLCFVNALIFFSSFKIIIFQVSFGLKNVLGKNESLWNRNKTLPENKPAHFFLVNMNFSYLHLTGSKHGLLYMNTSNEWFSASFQLQFQYLFSNQWKIFPKIVWSRKIFFSLLFWTIVSSNDINIFVNIIQLPIAGSGKMFLFHY